MARMTLSVMVRNDHVDVVTIAWCMARAGGAVDPPLVDVGLLRDLVTVALGFAMSLTIRSRLASMPRMG